MSESSIFLSAFIFVIFMPVPESVYLFVSTLFMFILRFVFPYLSIVSILITKLFAFLFISIIFVFMPKSTFMFGYTVFMFVSRLLAFPFMFILFVLMSRLSASISTFDLLIPVLGSSLLLFLIWYSPQTLTPDSERQKLG